MVTCLLKEARSVTPNEVYGHMPCKCPCTTVLNYTFFRRKCIWRSVRIMWYSDLFQRVRCGVDSPTLPSPSGALTERGHLPAHCPSWCHCFQLSPDPGQAGVALKLLPLPRTMGKAASVGRGDVGGIEGKEGDSYML